MVIEPSRSVITGTGESFPGTVSQKELWDGFFEQHFGGRRSARMAFRTSGVTLRHAALNPLDEDVSGWTTGARMERYLTEAMPLGKKALESALESAGLTPSEIGLFVVASCTGYATPGIDVRLAREIGMSPSVRRLNIGHTGCHAALPALSAVNDFVIAHQQPAVLLCVEISSLHLQPATTELEQVVVHSLFSDAAAAVVVEPAASGERGGLEIIDLMTFTDTDTMDYMTWNVTDHGFRMTLSRHVSDVVSSMVKPFVEELLERNGLSRENVDAWAIHPGGPRILDAVGDRLSLDAQDIACSRRTLEEHGNCSSPTILLVIDSVRRVLDRAPQKFVVALSFGPGMTLCAALLRST